MIAGPTGAESDRRSQATHVEFEDVSKSYDGRTLVVDDLNLGIGKGEFVTLLGPSGSGKTTILMMLAGFQTATSGAIRIGGRSVQDLPPRKRGIGMVFQNYALFPHMTVGANLAFPLEVRGIAEEQRRERVERALDLVRLGGLEDRRPGQLSGGQQQRVAIARALVFEPDLVLMDEPLGALDRSLREEMQYEIRSIHQRLGVTVVYVTHDQQEAMVMSDRIAVLNGGRIEQIAGAEGLYEEPERAFVARFIGENNRLHGRVALVEDDLCEVDVGGERIRAFRIAPCGVGDMVTLSIRPERIAIKPEDGLYHNEVEAVIEDMTFLGDHLRVRLAACGHRDVVAKIPNIVGHGAMMVGDAVRIGWTVNDCRALDFEGDEEARRNA
ncbi:ABC transporter ATP-binding protein [Candidatus Palauibacter soopunensis]|uniref:ABC transporter ATP-binding protein n=1 Tax=Candidatus Palauibacter soopunensis TaxID=3056739 RepID=UPI0023A572A3|nr:ABC transporter ATP-binding protein [Candidatus Palauibacter soopunensis]MDE2878912.1 ABC transporter ATP-binding protein [Candidatus Palauibacter soopunensis]